MIRSSHLLGAMIALLPAATGALAGAPTPPFDCRHPHSMVARTICESPEYVAMEREIAALTDRARAELSPGELSQLSASTARYLRQRNGCEWAAHNSAHPGAAVDECIRGSLEARVRRLRDVVARGGT